MKEIKDDIERWRDIPCSWAGRINIVKMTILPNAIYRFNVIPIKLPMTFFYRTRTKNFTIHMETQKTLNNQSSLEKECSWRNQASWLQIILQSYSHQDSMVLAQKNRNIDQWNKIQSPEINPHIYGHLIFDKEGNGEKTTISISSAGKTGQLCVKEWN